MLRYDELPFKIASLAAISYLAYRCSCGVLKKGQLVCASQRLREILECPIRRPVPAQPDLLHVMLTEHALRPGRLIVVGDLHGCEAELLKLLKKLHFDKKVDNLIVVGDLVNKGPCSEGVLCTLRRLQAWAVRGNHDAACVQRYNALLVHTYPPYTGSRPPFFSVTPISVIEGRVRQAVDTLCKLWKSVFPLSPASGPVKDTPKKKKEKETKEREVHDAAEGAEDRGEKKKKEKVEGKEDTGGQEEVVKRKKKDTVMDYLPLLTQQDVEFVSQLPYTITIPNYGITVVHAGLVPGVPLEEQKLRDLNTMRNVKLVVAPEPYNDINGASSKPASSPAPSPQLHDGENGASLAVADEVEKTEVGKAVKLKFVAVERSKDGGFAWVEGWLGPPHVIFGHDAKRRLQFARAATGLDSGCVYGGGLSAAVIPPLAELERGVDGKESEFLRRRHAGETQTRESLRMDIVTLPSLLRPRDGGNQ